MTLPPRNDSTRGVPSWAWLLLPLIAAAALRDLWAPDEPRYAEIAREIFDSGSFLVMHLNGVVYPDKPPLFFWLIGVFGKLTHWSELGLRVPTLASMAGTAWLVGKLARRWWGPEEARWAPSLFLGTVMVVNLGHRIQIDPLLCLLSTAALYLVSRADGESKVSPTVHLGIGALAGLGALAKGPVVFAIIGLVWIGWRLTVTGVRHPVSITVRVAQFALAVGPVLAWAGLAIRAEPALAAELLYGQHIGRVVQGERHAAPIYKHLMFMPVLLLPWTAPVLAGVRTAWLQWRESRRGQPADAGLIRAAVWLVVPFVFFSLIPAKRNLYLLPAYPAAALLASHWLAARRRARRLPQVAAWLGLAVPAIVGLALVAVGLDAIGGSRLVDDVPRLSLLAVAAGVPFLVTAAIMLPALRQGDEVAWGRRLLVGWACSWTTVAVLLFPLANSFKSARGVATYLAALSAPVSSIPCLGVKPEGYRFYGGVPTVAASIEDLAPGEGRPLPPLALTTAKYWERLPSEAQERYVILHKEAVGGRNVYVIASRTGTGGVTN